MASPQVENGYTAIANEIMDELIKIRVPGEAMQILLVILRKTYGWGKKEDHISLSQFYEATGMKKPSIIRAIKQLLAIKLISVSEKANRKGQLYEFNKDYDTWQPLAKKLMLAKKLTDVSNNANGVSEKAKNRLQKSYPQKQKTTLTKTNTKTKRREIEFILPDDINPEVWSAFIEHRSKIKKPLTEYAKHLIIEKLAMIGQDKNTVLKQSIVKGWQDVFELKDQGGTNGPGNNGRRGQRETYGQTQGIRHQSKYPVDVEETVGDY